MWIFTSTGVGASNPNVAQGSIVVLLSKVDLIILKFLSICALPKQSRSCQNDHFFLTSKGF